MSLNHGSHSGTRCLNLGLLVREMGRDSLGGARNVRSCPVNHRVHDGTH